MPIELSNFFSFNNVKNFNLSERVSNGNFVILTKCYRAKIIVDLTSLIEFSDFRRTTGPDIER